MFEACSFIVYTQTGGKEGCETAGAGMVYAHAYISSGETEEMLHARAELKSNNKNNMLLGILL